MLNGFRELTMFLWLNTLKALQSTGSIKAETWQST
jgi:hypothetical protein